MRNSIYEIDEKVYQRFDQKNSILFRYLWDKGLKNYQNDFTRDMLKNIQSEKEGYTHFDYAFNKASWTLDSRFPFAFSWEGDTSFEEDWYGYSLRKIKYKVNVLTEFTAKVKKAARFYGASLVGISEADLCWVYKNSAKRTITEYLGSAALDLPEGINRVIVLAIEMDPVGLSTTPALPAAATTGLGYSKMAFVISCLGEFIRNLGYRAIQCGNDTALSIPLAISAGLGALGRNGLLATPQYGSRVRLCKVFTDLPLAVDEPDLFFIEKVNSFCQHCDKCAEVCETGAISFQQNPKFFGETISNNSGVKKYYINPE